MALENRPLDRPGRKQMLPSVRAWLWLCFLGQLGLVLWGGQLGLQSDTWSRHILLLLGVAVSGASTTRRLPLQNVALAAGLVALIAGGAQILGGLRPGSWVMPAFWVLVILNAREVARLLLRPLRQRPDFGLWLLGTATVLVVFGVQIWPAAFRVATALSGATRLPWSILAQTMLGLLINIAIVPALTRKQPGEAAADFTPLLLWLVFTCLAFCS